MEDRVHNPAIPYVGSIPRQAFIPNKIVRIQGRVPNTAHKFQINLQCSPRINPLTDIALQVSVSFLEGCITLNSLQIGRWGEKQQGILVIQRSQNFEIVLSCDSNQYKVTINGEHYCDFPQRIHYSRITHLVVDGDVSISCISYEATPVQAASSPPFVFPQNANTGFEMINSFNAPLRNRPLVTQSEESPPPSYDVAVSGIPPYPTNIAPGAPGVAPLNEGGPFDLPYPSGPRTYLSPLPLGIHPPPLEPLETRNSEPSPNVIFQLNAPRNYEPPPNATDPLNAPFSRPARVDGAVNKCGRKGISMMVVILFIIFIIIVTSLRR